jgi:hypothetical protein
MEQEWNILVEGASHVCLQCALQWSIAQKEHHKWEPVMNKEKKLTIGNK